MNRAEQAPINKNTKTDIFDCTSGTALTTEAKLASIGFIETIDDNFDETSGTDSEFETSNSDEWSDVALDQGNFISPFLFIQESFYLSNQDNLLHTRKSPLRGPS